VIVDEALARRFYPNQNPLGHQVGTGPKPEEQYRIVGVVKSSRYDTLRQAMRPAMYRPSATANDPGSDINFVLRAAIDTRRLATSIHRTMSDVDPSVPLVEIKTQTALIDHLLLVERLLSILSTAFGVLAVGLSAVGLIGLLGYTVARRTNEIGVRMALGASESAVVGLVLRDSLTLLTIGIVIGIPGAFLVGCLLKSTLFNLHPDDPITGGISIAILGTVAAAATWLPASRAARIDPMTALREE
jgi:ABC-type antimicrobial peptide transport system permease subunit